jgi:uncharacterized membrane protein
MLDKKTKQNLAKLLKEAEKIKSNISNERDRLREICRDIEDICESIDYANQDFETAIDTLSQYL